MKKNSSNLIYMKNYGYIGKCFKRNIARWQADAFKNNPEIVSKIKHANKTKKSLDSVYGPVIYQVEDYFDADIVGTKNNKKLRFFLKDIPDHGENPDSRFLAPKFDKSAITDYSNAKALKVKIDTTELKNDLKIYLALEDLSKEQPLFALKAGANIAFENETEKVLSTVNDKGFLTLPKAFKGCMIIELSNKNLQNDLCNCEWDFKRVERFQVAFDGNKEVINQPIYIDGFYLDYNQDKQVKAWDFTNLTKRSDYRKGLLPWYGEFVGKHLTGLTLGYRVCPCESTRNAIFEIVNALANAQWTDGYIGVYNGCSRYSQFIDNWDVWNHYHAIIGLIECYKIFKDELSFKVAKRALDCIYKTFKNTSYLLVGGKETNRSIAHAYAEFYTISKQRRYLLEAERIIKEECQEENGWYKTALNDGEFYTSSLKRWEVLHTILTLGTLYREVKNPEYLKVLKRVWESLYNLDVHNTGGFSTNEGATGNPYSDGVIETCCSIAWMALTNELFQCEKSVKVADAFEVSYYNALLGSLTTGEVYCTYNTPMNIIDGTSGIFDGRRVPSQVDSAFQYTKGAPQMNCCQANIARGLGELGRWAHYCDKENNIYLNFLGKAEVKVNVCGKEVIIIQDGNYPCEQSIKFTVKTKDVGQKFSLNIRIPSWSNGAEVVIGNQKLIGKPGSYLKINKHWGKKEEISMNLSFDIRIVKGEKEQADYSSVYCGPVLLALEEDVVRGIGRNEEISSLSLCRENLLNASVQNGFVSLKAKTVDGKEVLLKDFARVGKSKKGKYTPYWSWIKVID